MRIGHYYEIIGVKKDENRYNLSYFKNHPESQLT